ncbi:MAG: TonB-dependent receptor [Gammaproteobacteria bacterium]|nr:TonB-dependent receptor [Gammaproteobacteria bacterium]
MKTNSLIARAVKLAIGGAVGLSAVLTAPMALAADEEEIVVTGSRIARSSDLDSASPVITVDREAIEKSGYTNLERLLEKLPSSGNGTFSTRDNNQDSTANGGAAISLRGLGADATLVLVNGRRVSISPFAANITTGFVDINAIPVSAIERIEVLKDGASAVYGSDAVAGVVNIVLRKDFDGFEVSAGYGDVTSGSNGEVTASAMWGSSSENGNITIIFDYFKNDPLFGTERGRIGTADQSRAGAGVGEIGGPVVAGIDPTTITISNPSGDPYPAPDYRSSRGYPGSFTLQYGTGSPTNPAVSRPDPSCPLARVGGASCFFDYGPFGLITPAAERSGLMLLGHRDMGSGVELFTEFAAQHNRSKAQGAPTPLDGDALLTVPVTHPGNPYAMTDGTGQPLTSIRIRRYRTVDAGPRQWDIQSDSLRALIGLRGTINNWDWEVAAHRGRMESEQSGDRSMGWVRTDFLQAEIDAGRYNPFSATTNPQSSIDAITTSLVRRGVSDLTGADATLTGELFDMPAGKVRMAAGLEYRDESVSDVPDDQFQRGLIFGTEAVSAAAQRNSWSAFVEFSLPLLENLELQLAGRYDDYSDFGDTTNPKVALRWAVTDTFALRGSWGQGFRAPSLAQIGLGPSDESQFFVDTYWCADTGLTPCPVLDYTIRFSGNPDLQAEESESYNFGFAWRPTASFSIGVDYWDIKQKNKIDEVPFGFLYAQNCDVQNTTVCDRLAPLPGDTLGELTRINASFTNIGEQTVNGIDLTANYSMDAGNGTLSLGLDYTHTLDFTRVELNSAGTGLVSRDLNGEYKYPKDRFVLTGNWQTGDWGFHAAVNYIGEFEDAPDVNLDGVLDYDEFHTRKVDAFMTTNLQVSYEGVKNTSLIFGADNVLDESPPWAFGDGDADVRGYVSTQHDPRGRFIYTKMTYRF